MVSVAAEWIPSDQGHDENDYRKQDGDERLGITGNITVDHHGVRPFTNVRRHTSAGSLPTVKLSHACHRSVVLSELAT